MVLKSKRNNLIGLKKALPAIADGKEYQGGDTMIYRLNNQEPIQLNL